MTQKPIPSNVYFEKEQMSGSEMLLQIDKLGSVWVSCSRSCLNLLNQKEAYKPTVIKFRMNTQQLALAFNQLSLDQHFDITTPHKQSDFRRKQLGWILATNQALSATNFSLSPVSDSTYTSLVEKPVGYLCWLDEGWVVLRQVDNSWYLLDPRHSPCHMTELYVDMIIKQVLLDKGMIFGVMQSQRMSKPNWGLRQSVVRYTATHSAVDQRAVTSTATYNGGYMVPSPATDNGGYMEPVRPPDPSQPPYRYSQRREEIVRFFKELTRFNIVRMRTRPATTDTGRERGRSEVRPVSVATVCVEERGGYDTDFPPLGDRRIRSRAKSSCARLASPKQNHISPPTATASTSNLTRGWKSSEKVWQTQPKLSVPQSSANEDTGDSQTGNCVVCLVQEPTHLLYPCGHLCLCGSCTKSYITQFNQCPICKIPVSDAIKLFKV